MDDYYNVLGVDKTASAEEIRRAYHRMAHKYHPDKSSGDEEKFKKVNTAYQVLKDPQKRSQYDQYGRMFEDNRGDGSFRGGESYNFNFEDLGGFGSIFNEIFSNGGRPQSRRSHGADINVDVSVSLVESAKGTKKDLSLRLLRVCEHCKGSAAEPGSSMATCLTCKGKGVVERTNQSIFGMVKQSYVCPECQGEGKKPSKECSVCRGQGRKSTTKTLTVDVPAGIKDGQSLRISGQGEAARRGGAAGDLYVTVQVAPHRVLRRDGNNVRSDIKVSFVDAALGAQAEVETLAGKKPIILPPGTQPNEEIIIPEAGFATVGGTRRGSQIVTVRVDIPRRLSKKQKDLLQEFRESPKKGIFF